VRLLLDQNLSPRLLSALRDLYPNSVHVRDVGLGAADDETVWRYAGQHRFVIVSKDADFHERSFVFGHPPKVVWIRRGNCSTDEIAGLLHDHHANLLALELDAEGSFLAIG
jgi:predicted nuclease of predicted toxin-antitoxin system